MKIGDSHLMLNDPFPEMKGCAAPAQNAETPFTINLYVEDADATFNKAIKAGAEAKMPPQDMFWGDRYGQFRDPFGYTWAIATHIEDVSPEELKKRAEAMFAQPAGR